MAYLITQDRAEKFRNHIRKMISEGVEFLICTDGGLELKDTQNVLSEVKRAYIAEHNAEFAEAYLSVQMRQEIDSHYPDDFEVPHMARDGCFSTGRTCQMFAKSQMDKLTLELVRLLKQESLDGCGECDLFLAQKQIDELRAKREKHEEELRRKEWANSKRAKEQTTEIEIEAEEENTDAD